MARVDDDNTAWASQFAELLARKAAAIVELFGLLSAEAQHQETGDHEAWVRSLEQLEALWRNFMQEQSEAFIDAWPDFVRNLTGLLPLVSRGQPLIAVLAQIVPLLSGSEVLSRAIQSRGQSLVNGLEDFLVNLGPPQDPDADQDHSANGRAADDALIDMWRQEQHEAAGSTWRS
ncbi:MAG: hypothetical protein ABIM50_15560 [Novosphingobium sp.]